jgi:hypothetical protein
VRPLRLKLICARIKALLSECVLHCPPRFLTLIGSLHEIASYFGNSVGERSGAVHLWRNRCPHDRFAEISSSGHIKSLTDGAV